MKQEEVLFLTHLPDLTVIRIGQLLAHFLHDLALDLFGAGPLEQVGQHEETPPRVHLCLQERPPGLRSYEVAEQLGGAFYLWKSFCKAGDSVGNIDLPYPSTHHTVFDKNVFVHDS